MKHPTNRQQRRDIRQKRIANAQRIIVRWGHDTGRTTDILPQRIADNLRACSCPACKRERYSRRTRPYWLVEVEVDRMGVHREP